MSNGGDFLGAFLEGLVGETQRKRQNREEQQNKLAQILLSARAQAQAEREFPSAEEQQNRILLRLIRQMIPREPTQVEAIANIPGELRTRIEQPGFVAVPGPEGGVVTGQGEVAPGQPSAIDVLTERLGLPQARQRIGEQQAQVGRTLRALSRQAAKPIVEKDPATGRVRRLINPETGETISVSDTSRITTTPEGEEIPQGLPDPSGLKEGTQAKGSLGSRYVIQNGRWVKVR